MFGDERGKRVAKNGLAKCEGYVRTAVAKNVRLRLAPEVNDPRLTRARNQGLGLGIRVLGLGIPQTLNAKPPKP